MIVHRFLAGPATALVVAASLLPGLVSAQEAGRDRARDVSLTVYNNDLGLVREVRPLRLEKGRADVRITDVAARIDPTSVHFLSLTDPAGTSVLEQNYQFDLVSAERILERYVDQRITTVTKDGREVAGTLLSYDGGSLVLRGEEGVQILSRAEVRDIRFPELPGGLITRPTLLWLLEAERGGDHRIELSYLTGGLSWHAEYVAVANPENTNMSLAGWVSLENTSGASYEDARLKLIAGSVHRAQPPQPPRMYMAEDMRAMGKQAGFEERSFFEYHLYELARRTTIADREVKQVSLFSSAQVPVRKVYSYDGQNDEKKVKVTLEFENRQSQGLGMPLPGGVVRVFQEDPRGGQEFVGEDRMDHTPKDEKVRVYVGDAFDVVGERAVMDVRRLSDHEQEQDIQVKIRNHKEERIEVVVIEHQYGDWKVLRGSHETRQKDAQTLEIPVAIEIDGEVTVTYTVRTRF
jgi:hypothetical protein